MKFAKVLRTSFLKNICERLLLHRGGGCDVDDVKEEKDKRIVNNKKQLAKEITDLGPINLTENLFC